MIITESRRQAFLVAWRIQQMMYESGFFRSIEQLVAGERQEPCGLLGNVVLRSDRCKKPEYRPNCEPKIRTHNSLGHIFTNEGLGVIFHHGRPAWMETRWGEWWCWEHSGPTADPHTHFGGWKEEDLFLSRVKITNDVVRRGEHPVRYMLSHVEGVELPPYEQAYGYTMQHEESQSRTAEWIMLCESMQPPRYPHWMAYVEANLPIPNNHPDYNYAQAELEYYRDPQVHGPLSEYARVHNPALR